MQANNFLDNCLATLEVMDYYIERGSKHLLKDQETLTRYFQEVLATHVVPDKYISFLETVNQTLDGYIDY